MKCLFRSIDSSALFPRDPPALTARAAARLSAPPLRTAALPSSPQPGPGRPPSPAALSEPGAAPATNKDRAASGWLRVL